LFGTNILYAMENSVHSAEMAIDRDSLLLAYAILLNVSRTIRDIQALVCAVLRYVAMGATMVNGMIGLIVRASVDEAELAP
jgi:hypothetical protein